MSSTHIYDVMATVWVFSLEQRCMLCETKGFAG